MSALIACSAGAAVTSIFYVVKLLIDISYSLDRNSEYMMEANIHLNKINIYLSRIEEQLKQKE